MNTRTKDALIFTILLIGGLAIAVGDLHRIILREAWPVITAYFDWLVR
jgi:hypothetical protein